MNGLVGPCKDENSEIYKFPVYMPLINYCLYQKRETLTETQLNMLSYESNLFYLVGYLNLTKKVSIEFEKADAINDDIYNYYIDENYLRDLKSGHLYSPYIFKFISKNRNLFNLSPIAIEVLNGNVNVNISFKTPYEKLLISNNQNNYSEVEQLLINKNCYSSVIHLRAYSIPVRQQYEKIIYKNKNTFCDAMWSKLKNSMVTRSISNIKVFEKLTDFCGYSNENMEKFFKYFPSYSNSVAHIYPYMINFNLSYNDLFEFYENQAKLGNKTTLGKIGEFWEKTDYYYSKSSLTLDKAALLPDMNFKDILNVYKKK